MVFERIFYRPPERIILDLDATDDVLHGQQEGRHGYYRNYCYLPLYIICGEHILAARFRQSNIDASAGAKEELERVVEQLRLRWPEVEIWIRADSGFCRESIMTWCEEHDVTYVLGLARNDRLQAMIATEMEASQQECEASGAASRRFFSTVRRKAGAVHAG